MNLELYPYKKDGETFRVENRFYMFSDYGIINVSNCKLYLKDKLVKNDNGNINTYYQLHTKYPIILNDTLPYNIECPKCRTYLKLHQLNAGLYEHSWYVCPRCKK